MAATARLVMVAHLFAVWDVVTDGGGLPLNFSFPHGMLRAPNMVRVMYRHGDAINQGVHVSGFDATNVTVSRVGAIAATHDPFIRVECEFIQCLESSGCREP